MLALGALPLVATVGMAVDYSRANSTRSAMQAAGDATALMLAKNAASSMNGSQLQANATTYFNANFNRPEAQNVQVTATYTQAATGFTLKVDATAAVNTVFLGVLGYSQIPLSTTGTVSLEQLETARGARARQYRIDVIVGQDDGAEDRHEEPADPVADRRQTNNGDVYVSIIPFAKDVNVGPSNYNQSWINWSGSSDTWDENNGTCSSTSYTNKSSCVSHGKTWTPKNHNTWNGCVMDRDQNFDTTNTAPTAGSTLFPGRAIFVLLPGAADGPELRLDGAQRQGRRDAAGRRHQPGDRAAVGLPVVDQRAVHASRPRTRTISIRRSSFC